MPPPPAGTQAGPPSEAAVVAYRKLAAGLPPHDDGPALLRLLAPSNTAFVDLEFPPTAASIGSLGAGARCYVWRRPAEFVRGVSPTVFGPAISAANVDQGELKSCWLACALAALAEASPEQVRRLFSRRWPLETDIEADSQPGRPERKAGQELMGVESLGLYQIRLCVGGEWRVVTIDDDKHGFYYKTGVDAGTRLAAHVTI